MQIFCMAYTEVYIFSFRTDFISENNRKGMYLN